MVFPTKIMATHHLQGNVQVYNVRIPVFHDVRVTELRLCARCTCTHLPQAPRPRGRLLVDSDLERCFANGGGVRPSQKVVGDLSHNLLSGQTPLEGTSMGL